MSLVELTEYLVKTVVNNADMVSVKEFTSDDPNTIVIQVMVDNEDMAKVIGKNGKVISSIRTLVLASSFIKDKKDVKINVDSF